MEKPTLKIFVSDVVMVTDHPFIAPRITKELVFSFREIFFVENLYLSLTNQLGRAPNKVFDMADNHKQTLI